MPGSFGKSDIYKVKISTTTELLEHLINLGKTINTEGRETYPFVNEQRMNLYFSSDGHPGLRRIGYFCSSNS
jgi:hypothetical protein